ncbi:ADP/ATP carrier protein [Entophlyctis luteolus]|nr:ADP/ATP carrier protein [Entophlyctis luteolus]KAJ3349323.1 ADP/ATP carrier protein [Entophlyctis luteolus]KAJ3389319.1 ADP/ATP carrier protein [Entophlyctis sp. JEL0112]
MGALAGALSQVFTLPIAVITTRQQTAPHDERESFFATLQTILRDEGAVGLWKGFKASMVLCSNPAITYGLFERVKGIWIRRKIAAGASPTLGSLEVFVVGALSKTLATVVTYPYIMAKVRMQWSPPKSLTNLTEIEQESFKYRDSIDVLKKVFATDGVAGWYKGMNTQIVKAVLCQAILFVSKEKFLEHTLTIFSLMGAAHHANITPVN